jgi:OmpR-family two-component system manganese-sensing sensor histidine kinase
MFQATRRRLALWYTGVTAVLLLLFATGFYIYVRSTLVERIDDTLNHVVEIVQRSLVIEPAALEGAQPRINLEASFPGNAAAVEDDHIDLEWFSPTGELLWSTFSAPLDLPLQPNSNGETVDASYTNHPASELTSSEPLLSHTFFTLRQITQPVEVEHQLVGYLRVSHPWFEVTKPSRQLIRDLSLGVLLVVGAVAGIGWLLSGLAIAPVRDSYQRLKQFTADASHELRNPIAVIQTNVQVALAAPDPSLQQNQLQVIERLTRRLGRLVDDLLFLARQDSGITGMHMSLVQVERLLQDVVEEQQALAVEKGVILTFWQDGVAVDKAQDKAQPDWVQANKPQANRGQMEKSQAAYTVLGDADQLTRLFTNLVSNAVQHTPVEGTIQVKLERVKVSNPALQVQVQDTGVGIAAEALPHIFDRFYRADPARAAVSNGVSPSSTGGSGLGLAIAKAIVESHNGQIQVSSVPNQGTTFTVTLPYPKSAALAPATASNASSPHGKQPAPQR